MNKHESGKEQGIGVQELQEFWSCRMGLCLALSDSS
jgi:hypothetical protein